MSDKNNILILGLLLLISEVSVMVAMNLLGISSDTWLMLLWDVTAVSTIMILSISLWLRLKFGLAFSQLGIVAAKIGAAVFIAESGLMLTFKFQILRPTIWQEALLDGVLFAVMAAPIIYHWAVKPVISRHPSLTLSLPIQMCVVISFAVLMFDLSLPLGVASGVPYVILVLVGLWFPFRIAPIILALVGTVLTVIGYMFSDPGGLYWMVLANRGLAIFAIWITAVLVVKYKVKADELERSRNDLKVRFKEQTQELRENEQRFRDFAQASSDWLWETDENLRFTYFSESIKEMIDVGLNLDNLLGKTRREIATDVDENSEKWSKHMEDMEAHKPIRGFTYTYVTPGGETVHFRVDGNPVYDDQGNFRGYRGAGHNITDKVLTENKVKASEERLSLIFESAAVPLAVIRLADSVVLFTNSAWLELFGLEAEEVASVRMEDLYVDIAQRRTFLEKLEAEGRVQGTVAEFKRKNGETFYASFNSIKTVLDDEDVVISGLIDITDRKHIEEELIQHRDHLEDLVAERTRDVQEKAAQIEEALESEMKYSALQQQFVSLVSHEFRTPLTIIDSTAQRIVRLKDKITPDQLVVRSLKIRLAVERMVGLIETTLYASRLDVGKIEMRVQPCKIRDLVVEICGHQSEISPGHDIRIDLNRIPEYIDADPKLLEHIFTNLLSNAVKYAPDNPLIEVTGEVKGDMALVSIKDHGLGISEDDLPHLTERYFRAKTAEGIQGTGLGLSVCREFVEMHGGRIEVESVEGQGSNFTVQLPIGGNGQ